MNRNFAGLGILFTTKSKQAREEAHKLYDKLKGIEEKLEDISKTNAFGNLIDALSLRKLSELTDKLNAVSDEVDNNINLTSNLESTYQQADKSAAQLAATTNMSREEFRKFKKDTAFFYDLNMDMGEVQKTALAMRNTGLSAEKLGFKNLAEFTKFLNVAGLDGAEFLKVMEGLNKNFNFTPKQARQMADEVAYIGREFGVGTEFMAKFGDVNAALNEQLRKTNRTIAPDEYQEYVRQIYLLAGAMEEVGDDPAAAVGHAVDMFNQLTGTESDLQNLMQGVGTDLPEMLAKMGLSTGDFATSVDLARAKPLEFAKAMSEMYAAMTPEQKNFADAHMLKEFGASADWLIKANFAKVAPQLEKVQAGMFGATGTLNKMADAYRSGITMQERYQRMQERFDQRLRNLTKAQGTHTAFMEQQKKAYKRLGDTIEKFSGSDGILGIATRAFLAYRVTGIQGATISVINSLSKYELFNSILGENKDQIAGVLGMMSEFAPQALAMVAALKFMGFNFSSVFSMLGMGGPIALVLGGLYLLETKFEGGIKGFVAHAEKVVVKNWPKVEEKFREGFATLMDKAPAILEGAGDVAAKLVNGLSVLMNKVDWAWLGEKTGEFLGTSFVAAFDFAIDVFSGLFSSDTANGKLGKGTDKMAETTRDKLVSSFVSLGKSSWKAVKGAVIGLLTPGFDAMTDKNTPLTDKAKLAGKVIMGAVFSGFALTALGGLPGMGFAGVLGKAVLGPMGKLVSMVGGGSKMAGAMKLAKIGATINGVITSVEELPKAWAEASNLINNSSSMSFEQMNDSGFKMAGSFAKIIDSVFMGIPSMIMSSLGISSDHFRNFYDYAVMETEVFMLGLMGDYELIKSGLGYAVTYMKVQWAKGTTFLMDNAAVAFTGIGVSVTSFLAGAEDGINTMYRVFKQVFASIMFLGGKSLLDLEGGFGRFKQYVLFDTLAPIVQGIDGLIGHQMRMIQKLLSSVPANMLPDAAKALMSLDLADFSLVKGTIFDPAQIELQRDAMDLEMESRQKNLMMNYASAMTEAQGATLSTSMRGANNAARAANSMAIRSRATNQDLVGRQGAAELGAASRAVVDAGSFTDRQIQNTRDEFGRVVSARDSRAALAKMDNPSTRSSAIPKTPTVTSSAPLSEGVATEGFAKLGGTFEQVGRSIVDAIRKEKKRTSQESAGQF